MSLIIILALTVAIVSVLVFFLGTLYFRFKKIKHEWLLAEIQIKSQSEKQITLQTELIDLREKVSQNSLLDPLTGLPSQKVFEDRLQLTLNQSDRYQLTFAVLLLNLDGFKIINGALGYDVANDLLSQVAEKLSRSIRQVDTISRFSGDSFAFILPQLSKPETAAYVAQRLIDTVSQPVTIDGQVLYVTASIGIATYPQDAKESKTLLQAAENALHQAKARGRNRYQFYRNEMQALSRRELLLNSHLRSQNIYQELKIYCQPIVDVNAKKMIGMESILVWQHPDFGLLKFKEFLRLAENTGKIIEIGQWLIQNACQQWLECRKIDSNLQMLTIPVSAKQLEHANFVHLLSGTLQTQNIDPVNLVLEITGDSYITNNESFGKVLNMLKHMGVQLAVSGFITGHVSFEHLRRFPIDMLKIEGNLVKDIPINNESVAIVKMVIALAKTLQLDVIVSGIESLRQKEVLIELGCTKMQGNLFSEPFPANEFRNHSVPSGLNPLLQFHYASPSM